MSAMSAPLSPGLAADSPMQGCTVLDVSCQAEAAIGSAFEGIVASVATGAADLVVSMAAWWVEQPSVDPLNDVIVSAQYATRPLILAILVGGVLAQSIRIIVSRKGEPLLMVATGLLRYALVSALGLMTLQIALQAGDAFAARLLDGAVGNFAELMRSLLTDGDGDGAFVVLLVALIAAVLSLVQWVLMALRQAGLLVLAAMLPLAASGSLTRSTRGWLDRILTWLIAMVVYKPAAAFIYYIGFSYMSSTSQEAGADNMAAGDLATVLTGVVVLLLAVIAMPVLLKFFAWSGTQISGGSGGGSGFLGAVGAVATSGSYGRSAVDRAAAMEANGPGSYARFGQQPPMTTPAPSGAVPAPGHNGPASVAGAGAGGTSGSAAAGASGVAGGVAAAGAAGVAGVRAAGRGMTDGTGGDATAPGGEPR